MTFEVHKLFIKPRIIGLVGNANEAKSNTIYWILEELSKKFKFNVSVYGLKCTFPDTTPVYSLEEIEQVRDSILFIDEMTSLFDLDNRKSRASIERTLRLIFHNNNVLVLAGLGENFKKFISAKLNVVILKKITIADLINGSTLKNIVLAYKGHERGNNVLNLAINEAIIFDGLHYHKINVPYLSQYDSKKGNVQILCRKSANNVGIKR